MPTIQDDIETLKWMYKNAPTKQALEQVWRFALGRTRSGWQRTCTSVNNFYADALRLLIESGLLEEHRNAMTGCYGSDAAWTPVLLEPLTNTESDNAWIVRAKRKDIERLLSLTRELWGSRAEMIQRATLHLAGYPKICTVTQTDKDRLAHTGFFPLTWIAEIRSVS